jgi:hypothetical protein
MSNNQTQGASIEAERDRAEFEKAVLNITCANADSLKRDEDRPEDYDDYVVSTYWQFWQAARRTPADAVGAGELPPLPEDGPCSDCQHGMLYTGRNMQNYARAAIAADRAQRKQAGQVGVKTWGERFNDFSGPDTVREAMEAEIADLRAQLARQSQGEAVGYILQSKGSGSRDLVWPHIAENYSAKSFDKIPLYLAAPASAQPAEVADAHALLSKFCVADREGGQPMTLSARIEELYSWYQDAAQPDQRESAAEGQDSANNGAEGEKA